jgi:hypothetical protein
MLIGCRRILLAGTTTTTIEDMLVEVFRPETTGIDITVITMVITVGLLITTTMVLTGVKNERRLHTFNVSIGPLRLYV